MSSAAYILQIFTGAMTLLVALGCCVFARRWLVRRAAARDQLYVRLIRSELMQAVGRGQHNFLIEHWTERDRRAAFTVAAQILGFLTGPDRARLEQIVEENLVLRWPLLRINRRTAPKRIAPIRQLAAFGNQTVQGTLHALMREDPSPLVRLEAAVAITVAGRLPAPLTVVRAVCPPGKRLTPNHQALFRAMAAERPEAMAAMATMHEDEAIRLLAIEAIGHVQNDSAELVLGELIAGTDKRIAHAAAAAASTMAHAGSPARKMRLDALLRLNGTDRREAA